MIFRKEWATCVTNLAKEVIGETNSSKPKNKDT